MNSLVEKTLNKAQELYEINMANIELFPEANEYGDIKINNKDLRRLIKQRTDLAWSNGVCYMLSAVSIDKERGLL
jgi:hypothetical protein